MADPESGILQRLFKPALAFLVIVVIGTFGYWLLEDMTALEALYMTVIIVTTVGLGGVHPLHGEGQIFTVFIIVFGVGAFTYFATTVANYFIAGEITGFLERRRMQKEIEQLKDHFIVCGFGRMGEQVAREFKRESRPLVIIERDENAVQRASSKGYLVIPGDAENDEVLKHAGVQRADGLVTVLHTDAANLMVTMSARALNEKLNVISRVIMESNHNKLIMAGAHRVLFPYGLGGRRMAQMALRPNVAEFLEVVMHDEELELWLEELTIAIGCELDNVAIGAANIRSSTGANVVAVRQRTGKLLAAPTPDTKLQAGDIIVALGTRPQLKLLSQKTRT